MDTTSISLLHRLQDQNQEDAWRRFIDLYAPLIYHWTRQQGLNSSDASELVQDILAMLVEKLPEFQYNPRQRFRGWLKTVTTNKVRDFHRRRLARRDHVAQELAEEIAVVENANLFDEVEHRNYLVKRAMTLMRSDFSEPTWRACWAHVAEGRKAEEVSQELGISINAVYLAKARVLSRLRKELEGLW